jgi:hypothetical protein
VRSTVIMTSSRLRAQSLAEEIGPHETCRYSHFWLRDGVKWRRGRDSNPRWSCPHSGLANRRTRPLCDLSRAPNCSGVRSQPSTFGAGWRRERDSNPRGSSPGCFQDSCLQPLGHPSTYIEDYTSGRVEVKRKRCALPRPCTESRQPAPRCSRSPAGSSPRSRPGIVLPRPRNR